MNRGLLVAGMLVACGAEDAPRPGLAPQNPSPMVETSRAHERLPDTMPPGRQFAVDAGLDRPVSVFVPAGHQGPVTLLIHFHGADYVAAIAAANAKVPVAAATVHLGGGSSTYQRPLSEVGAFRRIVEAISDSLNVTDLVVSSFSAGYGAVRALLRDAAGPVPDGILLLDGLHADYVPPGTPLSQGSVINPKGLEPFLAYAREAVQGRRRMIITHSTVFPGTYASTTETADWLVDQLELSRRPVLEWGPVGMQQVSEVRSGNLAIQGYAGNSAPDHVDHLHALPSLLTELAPVN